MNFIVLYYVLTKYRQREFIDSVLKTFEKNYENDYTDDPTSPPQQSEKKIT